jgi:hypothetical protein
MNQFLGLPSLPRYISCIGVFCPKKLIALLLLAVWMPATMCCALERAGVPFFQQCCEDDSSESSPKAPCTDKTCCLLESGNYQTANPAPLLVTPESVFSLLALVFIEPPQPKPGSAELSDSSPPELSVAWQFLSRTALPVRAPSLAS